MNDDLWNWTNLRGQIHIHGLRNSLLVAPMPTASTSQILGNNECFEPYTSNLYARRTSAGEFTCVSKHLMKDLLELGLWNEDMKNKIIAHDGSVQFIKEIPKHLRDLYKTVWEIKTHVLIDMAADRGAFICQSQSLNVWMTDVTTAKLTSMHFYGWKKGLKSGMYYLRTRAAADALKFTLDSSVVAEAQTLQQYTKKVEADEKQLKDSLLTAVPKRQEEEDEQSSHTKNKKRNRTNSLQEEVEKDNDHKQKH